MTRGRHVLILVENADGEFVLGAKKMYPPDIQRMVGGGVEGDEDSAVAASRELEEELGIKVAPEKLQHLFTLTADVRPQASTEQHTFITDVYYVNTGNQPLLPSSDLDGLAYFSREEVEKLIQRYAELPTEPDPKVGFAWADYGQLYGPMHQLALEALTENSR
jgi:8-oxo-dGTP pyrophosphatase MutT (NUDIX family)